MSTELIYNNATTNRAVKSFFEVTALLIIFILSIPCASDPVLKKKKKGDGY